VLKAGDTVFFRGNVVYKGTISVKWSGSGTDSQIVYDGNAARTWDTGKAIIDGENLRSRGFISPAGTVGFITIRNFEIRNMKYTGVACRAVQPFPSTMPRASPLWIVFFTT